jgi:hypothetical protein
MCRVLGSLQDRIERGFGHADQSNDPKASTTRNGYDLIAQGFGVGYNSVLTLVVSGPDAETLTARAADAIKTVADVDPTSVVATPVVPGTTLGFISLKSVTSPQDVRTTELVNTLRKSVRRPSIKAQRITYTSTVRPRSSPTSPASSRPRWSCSWTASSPCRSCCCLSPSAAWSCR